MYSTLCITDPLRPCAGTCGGAGAVTSAAWMLSVGRAFSGPPELGLTTYGKNKSSSRASYSATKSCGGFPRQHSEMTECSPFTEASSRLAARCNGPGRRGQGSCLPPCLPPCLPAQAAAPVQLPSLVPTSGTLSPAQFHTRFQ